MLSHVPAPPDTDTLIHESPSLSAQCFRYPALFEFDALFDDVPVAVLVTAYRQPEHDRYDSELRRWYRSFTLRLELARTRTLIAGATTEALDADALVAAANGIALSTLKIRHAR